MVLPFEPGTFQATLPGLLSKKFVTTSTVGAARLPMILLSSVISRPVSEWSLTTASLSTDVVKFNPL